MISPRGCAEKKTAHVINEVNPMLFVAQDRPLYECDRTEPRLRLNGRAQ